MWGGRDCSRNQEEETGLSATEVSGDTLRGCERFALCSQDIFTYLRHLSHLEKKRQVWEASALQTCLSAKFFFSLDCPACIEVRQAKIFFWQLSLHYLMHHESIYSHCYFTTDVEGRKCCFGQILINMFKTRHCYRRFSIRVKVSLKYRTTETFPKITTKLDNNSSFTNLVSHCGTSDQTVAFNPPFTGV